MTIKFYKSNPPYGFLNNFWKAKFSLYGRIWETTEHAYQAQKTLIPAEADKIWNAKSPREACNMGQLVNIRPDWNDIKDSVMKECVYAKFSQNFDLKENLLNTGDKDIIEDSPTDLYWGCGSDGSGLNKLGKILMEVRKELKNEKAIKNMV